MQERKTQPEMPNPLWRNSNALGFDLMQPWGRFSWKHYWANDRSSVSAQRVKRYGLPENLNRIVIFLDLSFVTEFVPLKTSPFSLRAGWVDPLSSQQMKGHLVQARVTTPGKMGKVF
jgi:hypothetical protein